MLVFDGDYPMAYGALALNRDLAQPIEAVRAALARPGLFDGLPATETVATLPEMRKGRVAVAVVKVVGRMDRPGNPLWGYRTAAGAYAAAMGDLAYYRALEQAGEVRIIASAATLQQHMAEWETAIDTAALPVGLIIGMEGADPITEPHHARDWAACGVRIVSLCHYGVSTYGHGTGMGTTGGLLPDAPALLEAMREADMILDLSHSSDATALGAMDIFDGPVLASHQNCRALVPGERQFPDDILRTMINRGGVVGVSFDTWMLYTGADWSAPTVQRRDVFPREAVTLNHVVDHIDHLCQLAGHAHGVAIGADTDGQGGVEGMPAEIDTVADYLKLAEVLATRGFDDEAIADVMYRNWQRFFAAHLP